jgi:hypothetical protein
MATTTTSVALIPPAPVFTQAEWLALAVSGPVTAA